MSPIVRLQTDSGPPCTVGDLRVTPQSQTLAAHLPFAEFVWNRPTAIVVERAGRVERIPVWDVTRIVQLVLLALLVVPVIRIACTRRTAASRRQQHG